MSGEERIDSCDVKQYSRDGEREPLPNSRLKVPALVENQSVVSVKREQETDCPGFTDCGSVMNALPYSKLKQAQLTQTQSHNYVVASPICQTSESIQEHQCQISSSTDKNATPSTTKTNIFQTNDQVPFYKKRRKRKPNFSDAEVLNMLKGVKKYYKIVSAKPKAGQSNRIFQQKRFCWERITETVNAVNCRDIRTKDEVIDKFSAMKRAVVGGKPLPKGDKESTDFTQHILDIVNGTKHVTDSWSSEESDVQEDDDFLSKESKNKKRRERKANFSAEEISVLLKEVSKYYKILSSSILSGKMMRIRKRCWQIIADKVNNVSTYSNKKVKRGWEDVREKFSTMKRCALAIQNRKREPKLNTFNGIDSNNLPIVLDIINSGSSGSTSQRGSESVGVTYLIDQQTGRNKEQAELQVSDGKKSCVFPKRNVDFEESDLVHEERVGEIDKYKQRLFGIGVKSLSGRKGLSVHPVGQLVAETVNKCSTDWTAEQLKQKWADFQLQTVGNQSARQDCDMLNSPPLNKTIIKNGLKEISSVQRKRGTDTSDNDMDGSSGDSLVESGSYLLSEDGNTTARESEVETAGTFASLQRSRKRKATKPHQLLKLVKRSPFVDELSKFASESDFTLSDAIDIDRLDEPANDNERVIKMACRNTAIHGHMNTLLYICGQLKRLGVEAGAVIFERNSVQTCGHRLSHLFALPQFANILATHKNTKEWTADKPESSDNWKRTSLSKSPTTSMKLLPATNEFFIDYALEQEATTEDMTSKTIVDETVLDLH